MMDKTVLNLIPFNVFPDIKSLINCIKDDIFSPFYEVWGHIISEKIKYKSMIAFNYKFFTYTRVGLPSRLVMVCQKVKPYFS
jgi:hypothetical protein